METKKKKASASIGLIIGGGTMIGMGLGFIMGNMPAYMFIGMGAGLVIAAMVQIVIKNSSNE